MPTENEDTSNPRPALPSDVAPIEEQPKVDEVKENEEPQEGDIDSLPGWARKSIEKANSEAASFRRQLREVQESLAKDKTPEQIQKLSDELAAANRKLIIRDHTEGLPKEIIEAPWVSWPEDEDGIKKVAADLRALVAAKSADEVAPVEGGELSGGLNPGTNGQPVIDDPAVLAERYGRRSRK